MEDVEHFPPSCMSAQVLLNLLMGASVVIRRRRPGGAKVLNAATLLICVHHLTTRGRGGVFLSLWDGLSNYARVET